MTKIDRSPCGARRQCPEPCKKCCRHVLGFKHLDPDINIAGVILNQVSGDRHKQKAVEAVEKLTDTEVIGVIERRTDRIQKDILASSVCRRRTMSRPFLNGPRKWSPAWTWTVSSPSPRTVEQVDLPP